MRSTLFGRSLRALLPLASLLFARIAQPAESAPPPTEAQAKVLRIIAIGDTGKGNETQYTVGRAVQTVCESEGGCAFALLLGDNVYPAGVTSPDDSQLIEKFEKPYAQLPFPFYVVLGNHDYGPSWEFWRAHAELEYAKRSKKFRMPDRHYAFADWPATFLAVDTNALFWDVTAEERAAFHTGFSAAKTPWKIAFGHHPYVSNGTHGNAGRYDGLPVGWMPGAGGSLQKFFEEEVCGKIDLYLSGHDHNLQDLGSHCGTDFVVSGAGASTTKLKDRNPTQFQASVPGFVLLEITSNEILLRFFDEHAKELHRRTIHHRESAEK